MAVRSRPSHEYPDDIFDNSRMTFGDHIEELRTRMLSAIKGLIVLMLIGFVLDAVGESTGNKNIGVGKPMLGVITDPVETQVRDFYYRRTMKAEAERLSQMTDSPAAEIERIRQKLRDNNNSLNALTSEERRMMMGAPERMPMILPSSAIAKALGIPEDQVKEKEILIEAQVYPAHFSILTNKGESLLASKQYLTTLSAQEAFVVYFKVSIICGIVLASPWILFQFWAFIGAGLYPHERKYVYVMFWPSLILFIGGVLLCQFAVLPGAVKALLKFNEWLGFDPDIRLNEWLGLALILPLVFGLSFQTPLVMIFLNRIGMFTYKDYIHRWRYACFILAMLSALLTPTPDVVTMMYLFVPMFGLYLLGILFCYYFPGVEEYDDEEVPAEEIAV